MRLTPKSLFFALVFCGLPLAVTVGWELGPTAITTPPATTAPDGLGGIGPAPERARPDRPVDYPERTHGTRSPSSTAPVVVPPRTAASSGPPSSAAPTQPPSADPSVPAPTMAPSETAPSDAPSAEPPGADAVRSS